MKKAKDEMRSEYKRSDFAQLERGKFYAEIAKGTTVVLLSAKNARVFRTSKAVNDALAGLITHGKQPSRMTRRPARTRAKAARTG